MFLTYLRLDQKFSLKGWTLNSKGWTLTGWTNLVLDTIGRAGPISGWTTLEGLDPWHAEHTYTVHRC